jgi:ribosome biogenesis protein Nip4
MKRMIPKMKGKLRFRPLKSIKKGLFHLILKKYGWTSNLYGSLLKLSAEVI